jgi:DNA (cytosine-5)-methyltransferase 1
VLAQHYPGVPDLGDINQLENLIKTSQVVAPEVLVGGTPCQSFSIAGTRESLGDARGNLALTYVRIANAIDDVRLVRGEPGVITVWENVPGVLSTKDNAFGCLLGALVGEDVPLEPPGGRWKDAGFVLGPQRSAAWRCLDAQYFNLAQRRKRVFLISGPRDWFHPQEILFEWESCRRDTPPIRTPWKNVAPTTENGSGIRGQGDETVTVYENHGQDSRIKEVSVCPQLNAKAGTGGNNLPLVMRPEPINETAATLTSKFPGVSQGWTPHNETQNLIPVRRVLPFDTTQITSALNYSHPKEGDPCHPIASTAHPPAVVMQLNGDRDDPGVSVSEDLAFTIPANPMSDRGQAVCCLENNKTAEPMACDIRNGTVGETAMSLQAGGMGDERGMCINAIPHVIALQDVRVMDKKQNGRGWNEDGVSYTIDAAATQGVAYGCDLSQKAEGIGFSEEQAPCVAPGTHPGHGTHAVYPIDMRNAGRDPDKKDEMNRQGVGVGDEGDPMHTLSCAHVNAVAMADTETVSFKPSHYTRDKDGAPSNVCPPLTKEADRGDQDPLLLARTPESFCVRRLTPEECEALMGFPRGYTKISWKGKPADLCPDGPRYKAIGNSMAVTVMSWIGSRIDKYIKRSRVS